MSSSDSMDGGFVATFGAASIRQVPLLHGQPQESPSPAQLRLRLHDLSNTLTGLLGNLELAAMAAEDGELDLESMQIALESARSAMLAMRELKQGFDQSFPLERQAVQRA